MDRTDALILLLTTILVVLTAMFMAYYLYPEEVGNGIASVSIPDVPIMKPEKQETQGPPPDSRRIASLIFNLTNGERVSRGLHPLSYDEDLKDVANWQSICLVRNNIIEHDSVQCGTLEDRFEDFNLSNAGGENLYRGGLGPFFYLDTMEFTRYYTEEEIAGLAVSGWMNSTTHRENILSPDYTHMAVGFADDGINITITQNFMIEEDCGWGAEPCCDEGGGYYSCYNPYECDATGLVCK